MSTKITLIDDLDQSVDAEKITFSLDGVDYEIDLASRNAAKLRKVLQPFIEVARATGKRRSNTPKVKQSSTSRRNTISPDPIGQTEQMKAMRDWGNKNGYPVSDRGRVPKVVIEAFNEAHSKKNGSTLTRAK